MSAARRSGMSAPSGCGSAGPVQASRAPRGGTASRARGGLRPSGCSSIECVHLGEAHADAHASARIRPALERDRRSTGRWRRGHGAHERVEVRLAAELVQFGAEGVGEAITSRGRPWSRRSSHRVRKMVPWAGRSEVVRLEQVPDLLQEPQATAPSRMAPSVARSASFVAGHVEEVGGGVVGWSGTRRRGRAATGTAPIAKRDVREREAAPAGLILSRAGAAGCSRESSLGVEERRRQVAKPELGPALARLDVSQSRRARRTPSRAVFRAMGAVVALLGVAVWAVMIAAIVRS